jgi:acetyl esterase/lipase
MIKLKKIILLLLFTVSSSVSTYGAINRYGMQLTASGSTYNLTHATSICALVDCETLPTDAYKVYTNKSVLLSEDDYAYCKTVRYVYKTYNNYTLSLEVDIPLLTKGPHPFIIYVHGGSWTSGGWAAFINQSKYAASRGIGGVRISYSLIAQGAKFDLGMQELADVYAFVQAHSEEWNFDMMRFGYAAGSAGTPLASLAAMKHNGNGCKLFIGCNGIYDFEHYLAGSFGITSDYLSAYPTKESRRVISSINYIPENPENIPAVTVFHGTADFTISHLQSVALCDSIIKKGGHAEKNIYDYYVHGLFNSGGSDLFEAITIKMYEFARSVFDTPEVTFPVPVKKLIARFPLTTGENQLKAVDVHKGITVSDIKVGASIHANFISDALETTGWGALAIATNKYVGISIKTDSSASFIVNQIDVVLKSSTSGINVNGIFNFDNIFPPTAYKSYQKNGISGVNYSTASLLSKGVTAQSPDSLCFGIGIYTGSATTEVITFDEIAIYGDVILSNSEETAVRSVDSGSSMGGVYVKGDEIYVDGFHGETITIYNLLGVKILQYENLNIAHKMVIPNQGFYLVCITNHGIVKSKKIIIKK